MTSGSSSVRGLIEAPALAAGPNVSVVPVLGWNYGDGVPRDRPACELVGILIMRADPPPEWVPVIGARDSYPSAEASAPPPVGIAELTARAFVAERRVGGLALGPPTPGLWPELVVSEAGQLVGRR